MPCCVFAAGALAQAEKEAVGASNATSIDYKIAQQLARNKRPATKQGAKQSRTQVSPPFRLCMTHGWRLRKSTNQLQRVESAAHKAVLCCTVDCRHCGRWQHRCLPALSRSFCAFASMQVKRQVAAAHSDSEEEEEEEDGSEDDSDAPLPGELDESDDDDEADIDLEGAAGAGSEEEDEEEEEEEEQAGSGSEEEEEEEGSEDEIAKAVMEMDSDDLAASSDEEEGGSEEAEEEERQQQAAPATGKRKREQQAQQAQQAQQPRRGAAAGAADGGGEVARQQEQQGGKRQKGFFDAAPKDTRFSAKVRAPWLLCWVAASACGPRSSWPAGSIKWPCPVCRHKPTVSALWPSTERGVLPVACHRCPPASAELCRPAPVAAAAQGLPGAGLHPPDAHPGRLHPAGPGGARHLRQRRHRQRQDGGIHPAAAGAPAPPVSPSRLQCVLAEGAALGDRRVC